MTEAKKSIYEKVLEIQANINVPKSQYNKFGNFYYRNTDDILNALKPFFKKLNLSLFLTDDLIETGNRYYIKSIAKVVDNETKEEITTIAYAREPENKKGMDEMQITGATSSYARKYALNGLFAIDDSKDSDYYAPQGAHSGAQVQRQQQYQRQQQTQQRAPQSAHNSAQDKERIEAQNLLLQIVSIKGISANDMTKLIKERYKKEKCNDLTISELKDLKTFIASM